jgi:hypothetical protein
MSFKDMLSEDARIFTNNEEMGITAQYQGTDIDVLYDELSDEELDAGIFRISASSLLVLSIAKNDIFVIDGIDYKVIDFQSLDGVTDIILNKRAV